ncbi:kinase-like domain-containing protein [Cytidiella melzeri]|nr:kinase-like domain-containing protein [Cytidiella melzeri]
MTSSIREVATPDEQAAIRGKNRSQHELAWAAKSDFLHGKGYLLRPRYLNGWVPSWERTGEWPQQCEDFYRLPLRPNLIDATRRSDGKLVYIKRVLTDSKELRIAQSFSKQPLKDHPANHCVPVVDSFEDDANTRISYLVMPFLRYTDDPPFELVDDVLDIVDQLFEGIAFMHAEGVAHRDCAYKNIMMDGSSLYPKGFHPVVSNLLPDVRTTAKPYARFTAPQPVKYYFVDFGISESFAVDQTSRLVVGTDGLDADVPELSDDKPYDPFKVDIFILGNFFKQQIFNRYANVEFLASFVESMTALNPESRPDAAVILQQWQRAKAGVTLPQRTQYLKERSDHTGGAGFFLLPFLSAGPVLLIKGMFSNARWTRALRQ